MDDVRTVRDLIELYLDLIAQVTEEARAIKAVGRGELFDNSRSYYNAALDEWNAVSDLMTQEHRKIAGNVSTLRNLIESEFDWYCYDDDEPDVANAELAAFNRRKSKAQREYDVLMKELEETPYVRGS
jgi:hypothetical protein